MIKDIRNKALFSTWLFLGEVNMHDILKGAFTPNPSTLQVRSTYDELADKFNISNARVRSILMYEMRKYRESMNVKPRTTKTGKTHGFYIV